jgi:hypothetical protein
MLIKLHWQRVLCFSILVSFDTPAPQAASCSSRFQAIAWQKASEFASKQKIQTFNPKQMIEHNGWEGMAHC